MLYQSKAQEIARLNRVFSQNGISQNEYNARLSSILNSAYRVYDNGVGGDEEKRLLWDLAVDDIISQRDYDEQVDKIKFADGFVYDRQTPGPLPIIRRKKGYVAPIVWIIIGWIFCHWFLPLGILILILALIGLSCRVSYNRRVEAENAQTMMRYGAVYGGYRT